MRKYYEVKNNEIIEYEDLLENVAEKMGYVTFFSNMLIDAGYAILGRWEKADWKIEGYCGATHFRRNSKQLIKLIRLQQLLNISPNWHDSLEKAQDQVIRNLKRELEKVIGISEARLQLFYDANEEKKELQTNLNQEQLLCDSRYRHIQETERKIEELERELIKEQGYTESLLQDIELRKECISRFHERAEKYEDKCDLLEKIVVGQKKIIDEKMSKIESLQDALKLVQGHAKNWYEENCNLKNCLDEYQKIIFDQHDKIAELEATLERIRMEVVSQTNKSSKRGAK